MDHSNCSQEGSFDASSIFTINSIFISYSNNRKVTSGDIYKLLDLPRMKLNKNQIRLELLKSCPVFIYANEHNLSMYKYAEMLSIQLNCRGFTSCKHNYCGQRQSDQTKDTADHYCSSCLDPLLTGTPKIMTGKFVCLHYDTYCIDLDYKYDHRNHSEVFNSDTNYSDSLIDLTKIFTVDGKISSDAINIKTLRIDFDTLKYFVDSGNFLVPYYMRISSLYWLKQIFLKGDHKFVSTVNLKHFNQLEILVICESCDLDDIIVPGRVSNGILVNNIKFLNLHKCPIGYIDMEPFVNLVSANLTRNNITRICLDTCKKLKHFAITKNNLVTLDISKCKELESLYVFDNGLKEIIMYGATNSTNSTNNTQQDVSSLTYLDLSNNKLERIAFRPNNKLEYVDLTSNKLTYLDLTTLDETANVKFYDNLLYYEDIKHPSGLNLWPLNDEIPDSAAILLTSKKRLIIKNNNMRGDCYGVFHLKQKYFHRDGCMTLCMLITLLIVAFAIMICLIITTESIKFVFNLF